MATIRPFRGLLYSTARVADLQPVIAPPYDVLSAERQQELRSRDPHNIVHLDLPAGEAPGKYTQAASLMQSWRNEGLLVQDTASVFYVCSQRYALRGMSERTRWGFIGLLKIEEDAEGVVRPHERTLDAPRRDRLELMAATRAQISPIFLLYSDPAGTIGAALEACDARPADRWARDDAGVETRLWRMTDPAATRAIALALAERPVWIADGHHRYAASRELRDRLREESPGSPEARGAEWVLSYFSAAEAAGLSILPYHRAIRGIEGFDPRDMVARLGSSFDVKRLTFEGQENRSDQIRRRLRELALRGRQAIGCYHGGAEFLLLLPKTDEEAPEALRSLPEPLRRLDVEALHRGILEPIFDLDPERVRSGGSLRFTEDAARAIEWVDSGEAQAAFLLNATRTEQLMEVSSAGLQMPQKSTFFYPKVLSGLVLNPLDEPASLPEAPAVPAAQAPPV